MKSCHLSNLLAHDGSALEEARNAPVFFFANRSVEKLNCTVFHHRSAGQHQENLPLMGYFHYQTLARKRREKLTPRPHPGRGNNGPVRRIYQRKLSKVTPQQWSQDPYLARLLITTKIDSTFVHLFKAEITSQLLETLDNPTLSMNHISWPMIRHVKIPFEPYSNFRERIMGHLLAVDDSKAIAKDANKRKLKEENEQTRRVRLKR
ncbi:hypothetical protein QQX98_006955 [Neonectria punicea]|uniref:Uncharacterized protein n=1 Tax=Neonectria punicea TaxID=979145 RepID=A0ABR1GZW6_9HYPO